MEPRIAKIISEYSKRPELEAMLLDEKFAYFAMHEAEKVLTISQWDSYMHWLISITRKGGDTAPDYAECCTRATAAQRAEAFLRCIGKWIPA